MSKRNHDHHELPQYYLEGFRDPSNAESAFLWIFERGASFNPGKKFGNNPRYRSVSKSALKDDAYVAKEFDGRCHFDYEIKLQQKEHEADTVIRSLRKFEAIDVKGKDTLASYIGLSFRRTSHHNAELLSLVDREVSNSNILHKIQKCTYSGDFLNARKWQQYFDYLHSKDGKIKLVREYMLMNYQNVHAELLNMRWVFVKSNPSNYFVTSDNPVVFDRNVGLRSSFLMFPICSRVSLLADHLPGADLIFRSAYDDEVRKLNSIIILSAKRAIYSPQPDEWIHQSITNGCTF